MRPDQETPIEQLTRLPGSDDDQEAIVTVHDAGLAELDRAKVLLAHAKETMDLSIPADLYARAQAATAYYDRGTAMHSDAAEIRLRAARTMGEISKLTPTSAGGRPAENKPLRKDSLTPTASSGIIYAYDAPTKKQVLAGYGIPAKNVHTFERVAELSEDQFEGYISKTKNALWDKNGEPVSVRGAVALGGHRTGKRGPKKQAGLKCRHCEIHCPAKDHK